MTARRSARKRSTVRARVKKGLAKVERLSDDLPGTLDEFSRRMHRQLTLLEHEVERAETRARREIARVLRQASHRLGRFEAEGEKRWDKLTAQARREALAMLQKLEKRIAPKKSAGASARPAASARAKQLRKTAGARAKQVKAAASEVEQEVAAIVG